MTSIESAEIRRQIYLEWYKNGEAKKLLEILDEANAEIAKKLLKTNGVYTKKRYSEVSKFVSEISKEASSLIEGGFDIDNLIDAELSAQKNILKRVLGNKNAFTLPTARQVKNAALFAPVTKGVTFESFINTIGVQMYNVWDSYVRTGYLTGLTTDEIVRGVLGSNANLGAIDVVRRRVEANTRTALHSFATETRNAVYEKNDDLFSGYKWLATLDTRTCLVCGKLDGTVFKSIKEAPEIPIHVQCRCLLVPEIKGFDYIGERAAMDGQAKGDTTYEEWLRAQTETIQREVLGASRYKMYKSGVRMSSFVAGEQILTVEELKKRYNQL